MLEQIHIKDVATFKDECISDLKKINFGNYILNSPQREITLPLVALG